MSSYSSHFCVEKHQAARVREQSMKQNNEINVQCNCSLEHALLHAVLDGFKQRLKILSDAVSRQELSRV